MILDRVQAPRLVSVLFSFFFGLWPHQLPKCYIIALILWVMQMSFDRSLIIFFKFHRRSCFSGGIVIVILHLHGSLICFLAMLRRFKIKGKKENVCRIS